MRPEAFGALQSSLAAQMTRLNTVASNLANAGSVAGSAEEAFRPLRAVFETEYLNRQGLAGVRVDQVVSLNREPLRLYRPDHPMADAEGFVFQAPVNPEEEMVEMIEASRQYQSTLDALSTLRTLMMRTVQMGK